MLRKLRMLCLFIALAACVEPYEFVVHDPTNTLVVEASISDKSFYDTREYPSDGRYFSVRLTQTGDVINVRPVPVKRAVVDLQSSRGELYLYTEDQNGYYYLRDRNFKAQEGVNYKLRVSLPDERIYESHWEALPEGPFPAMGDINFEETEKPFYTMEANEWVVRYYKGADAHVTVGKNTTGNPIYYRWTFSPMWIYKAPLSSVVDAGHICWATDVNYLNSFELQTDFAGGYQKDLFFFQSVRNARIFEKLSVLVTQQALTVDFYNFWKEMKDQNEGTALVDTPPYNLKTNYSSALGGEKVTGFFGVVAEQARRWYVTAKDFSYPVPNTLRDDCLANFGGPPAPECFNCVSYSFGAVTTEKPEWWEN